MNTCKNPDKIYLSDFQLKTISIRPSLDPNTKDVEYIRKDALLEWAKGLNEAYHKKYEESNHTCGEHWGQMVAFQRMVDKLNSI